MAEPAAHPLTVAEAAAYGLTPGDLSDWAPLTPVQIHWARKHALTPAVARQWAQEGLHVGDAALLIHDGWTLDEATAARYAGIATGIRGDEDP